MLKLAEDTHDATTWAVISGAAGGARGSSSGATRNYLAARASRFVLNLGRAVPELFPWWGGQSKEAAAVAVEVFSATPARDLGPTLLVAARGVSALSALADKALLEQFSLGELPKPLLMDLAFDDDHGGQELLEKLDKKHRLPLSFWRSVVADDRMDAAYSLADTLVSALKRLGADAVPADFLLDALAKRHETVGSEIATWLSEAKGYPGLDVERVKGLLFDNNLKGHGLAILGNRALIKPTSLGLPWLLALARRRDNQLSEFAKRTLLEHLGPADFADGGKDGATAADAAAGTARLFELALSPTEQPAMRAFAQTYLRCHHPDLSESQPESKLLGLKPQLKRQAYTADRLWPALRDEREDVRRFAVAVAKVELRRWGKTAAVAALADTDHQEVRRLATDALTRAGDPAADPACTCTVEELSADAVFPLTESKRRPVREAGLALIRAHYARLGGEQRLAWLMTSADREVRLFAARLVWDKHRPRSFPSGWKPKKSGIDAAVLDGSAGAPSNPAAIGAFLRRVLYSLPLGRSLEAKDGDGGAYRRLPTSIAKRRLIEVVRDLALEDDAFADAAVPVLQELAQSLAKGEWQACVQALCAIDARRRAPLTASSNVAAAAE